MTIYVLTIDYSIHRKNLDDVLPDQILFQGPFEGETARADAEKYGHAWQHARKGDPNWHVVEITDDSAFMQWSGRKFIGLHVLPPRIRTKPYRQT